LKSWLTIGLLGLLLAACQVTPPPTGDITPPDTPSNLSAQAGNAQATLTWDANDETDLDHYNVYQGTVSGLLTKVAEVAAGSGPYTATGLTNGTTYLFAIDAWDDSDNNSAQTAEVAVTPSDTAPIVCVFGDAAALFGSCVFAP
jgi:hypothetical protein